MSITAISLDRFQLIVYPTKNYLKRAEAAAGLLFIWFLSCLMSSPLYMYRSLDHHPLWPTEQQSHSTESDGSGTFLNSGFRNPDIIDSVNYCYEEWPIGHGRAFYSIWTIVVQYAVPILIVSVAHAKICRRLTIRQSMMGHMNKNTRKQAIEKKVNISYMCIIHKVSSETKTVLAMTFS